MPASTQTRRRALLSPPPFLVDVAFASVLVTALALAPEARAQPLVPFRAELQGAPSEPSGDVAVAPVPGAPEHGRVVFARSMESGLAVVAVDGGARATLGLERGPFRGVDALAVPGAGATLVAATAYVSGQVRLWWLFPDAGLADALPDGVEAFNGGPVALGRAADGGVDLAFAAESARTVRRVRLTGLGDGGALTANALESVELPAAPRSLGLHGPSQRLVAVLADGRLGTVQLERGAGHSASGVGPWETIAVPSGDGLGAPAYAVAPYGLADGGVGLLVSVPLRGEVVALALGPSGFSERARFAVGNDASSQRVRAPRHLAVATGAAGPFLGGLLAVHDVEGTGAGPSYKLVDLLEASALLDGGLPLDACLPCPGAGSDAGSGDAGAGAGGSPCSLGACGPTPGVDTRSPPQVIACSCGAQQAAGGPLWGALALALASWRKSRRKHS